MHDRAAHAGRFVRIEVSFVLATTVTEEIVLPLPLCGSVQEHNRGGPLTSGGKCRTTELSPIIDLCVPTAVVYPRGQCASRVELPVKIGCGLVEQ